jgi:hypothetical protein
LAGVENRLPGTAPDRPESRPEVCKISKNNSPFQLFHRVLRGNGFLPQPSFSTLSCFDSNASGNIQQTSRIFSAEAVFNAKTQHGGSEQIVGRRFAWAAIKGNLTGLINQW